MSKLLLLAGVLALTASAVLAGSKCNDAKDYLDKDRPNLIATFNLETSNEKVKITQQAALVRLGVLDKAIDRSHEFLCGFAMKNLKADAEFVETHLGN